VANPRRKKVRDTYVKGPTPAQSLGQFAALVAKELQKVQRASPNTDTVIVTADYDVEHSDRVLLVDTTGGPVTITLRRATESIVLPLAVIRTAGSAALTIVPSGSDTIGGAVSITVDDIGIAYVLLPDSIDTWWVQSTAGITAEAESTAPASVGFAAQLEARAYTDDAAIDAARLNGLLFLSPTH
jgi:hypothetical protein